MPNGGAGCCDGCRFDDQYKRRINICGNRSYFDFECPLNCASESPLCCYQLYDANRPWLLAFLMSQTMPCNCLPLEIGV